MHEQLSSAALIATGRQEPAWRSAKSPVQFEKCRSYASVRCNILIREEIDWIVSSVARSPGAIDALSTPRDTVARYRNSGSTLTRGHKCTVSDSDLAGDLPPTQYSPRAAKLHAYVLWGRSKDT
jgi:hypothetical protein